MAVGTVTGDEKNSGEIDYHDQLRDDYNNNKIK